MVNRLVFYVLCILTLAVGFSHGVLPTLNNNCGVDWIATKDTCYFHRSLRWGKTDEATYAEAKEFCKKRFSTLVQFTSQKQWKSAVKFLASNTNYDTLLDLTRDLNTGAWKWGNGDFLDDSRPPYWNEAPQSALSKYVPDLALTTQGTFTLFNAHDLGGFACTAQQKDGKCPENFIMVPTNTTTCFYLSDLTNTTQMMRFVQIFDLCKEIGGKVATIETENDAESFIAVIPKNLNSEKVWKFRQSIKEVNKAPTWIGPAPPKSIKWAIEPDNLGGVENCAILYTNSGKISDVPCESRFPFTCQKPNVIPRLNAMTGKSACGNKDWIRGGDSCYFISETKFVNWKTAQLSCLELGSNLVKIDSDIERMWLSSLRYMVSWTGLCYDVKTKMWTWQDGTTENTTAIPWQQEPKTERFPHGACAAATSYGEVMTFSCNYWNYYICEQRAEDATECPKDWVYFNTSCYYLNNQKKTTWRDARLQCQKDAGSTKGYLYVPYGVDEWKFVVDNLLAKQKDSKKLNLFWIGLTDDNTGVWGFEWANTGFFQPTDVSHISWRKNPYYQNHIGEEGISGVCAVLNSNGKYEDFPTYLINNMICETPLFLTGPATQPFTGAADIRPNFYIFIVVASVFILVGI